MPEPGTKYFEKIALYPALTGKFMWSGSCFIDKHSECPDNSIDDSKMDDLKKIWNPIEVLTLKNRLI